MKKLPWFLLVLFLLLFISTNALAAAPNAINQKNENPQIQKLVKELKDVRKEKRIILDNLVLKTHNLKVSLEGKDKEALKKIQVYEEQINTINKAISQLKEKKKVLWKEVKKSRENNDLAKLSKELNDLINFERQSVDLINKKITIIENMISILG